MIAVQVCYLFVHASLDIISYLEICSSTIYSTVVPLLRDHKKVAQK